MIEPTGEWYQVNACDPVLGVGAKLEKIKASSREAAEETARARHGKHILVSLAGGKPHRRRATPRDLGNTQRHR